MSAERWRAAWAAALDELEADVEAVEAALADEHRRRELPAASSWSAPTGLGPLPLDLRPRADEILARQLAAARQLTAAVATNRRQAALVSRIEVGTAGKRIPSYVDLTL